MSVLLQCHHVTHTAGTKTLFEDIELIINHGDRIGLVGHNGSGKSSLLALLNSSVEPDAGEMTAVRGARIETVEQFIDDSLNQLTLFDAVLAKLPMENRNDSAYRAERLLEQFGFETHEFGYRVGALSGGQQNRLMFTRAVITDPDLILFDEPTNHLDLKTLLYFEQFLCDIDTAYLLISHDREFLDAVTERTLFLRDRRLYSFAMPFSQARSRLAELDVAAEAARNAEEKQISALRASAKRLAHWGKVYDNKKLARKAKSMQKRVEKLDQSKTFVSKGSGLKLTLDVENARARQMLRIEHQDILPPTVGGKPLFHIDDMLIRPGDRVALLGHNGVGKTTLIKTLMQQYEDSQPNRVTFNPRCRIGYYDQELELLDPDRSLLETLRDNCSGTENEYTTSLIRAGFPYRDLGKQVAVLSGGERARLMFLIIRLNRPNFLILDEPTNHIDIDGKEELEGQILDSDATVLITSHDRRFVDVIASRYLLISNGQLMEINEPRDFYEMTSATDGVEETPTGTLRTSENVEDEESILSRIIELEQKLSEDLARKPKFQKPRLQAEWRDELAGLNSKLP